MNVIPRPLLNIIGSVEIPGAPSDDAPRVTIRSRIKDALAGGHKTPRELVGILNKQGVGTDAQLVGQHFYLMTRDKITVKNELAGTWGLA